MRPIAALLVLSASPSAAEVVVADASGFELLIERTVAAPPARVWAILIEPRRWWSGAHTYSGDAANLALDARAGGCFCERLAGGGAVEHGRVLMLRPSEQLRLEAPLGPLQGEALAARLDVTLRPVGEGTQLTVRYLVGGRFRNDPAALARPVDAVLTEQVDRLTAAARG